MFTPYASNNASHSNSEFLDSNGHPDSNGHLVSNDHPMSNSLSDHLAGRIILGAIVEV